MLTGECIYCGQIRQVEAIKGTSEEEANRLATLGCECAEGMEFRRLEETKSMARANIELLFREEYPKVADLLNAALDSISERTLDKVTIKDGNATGTIMVTAKGFIKVKRSEIQEESMES